MSTSVGDVWQEFVAKLRSVGYELDDLEGCTTEVFQSVVQELGGFSALQTARLLSEWQRQSSSAGQRSRIHGAMSSSLAAAAPSVDQQQPHTSKPKSLNPSQEAAKPLLRVTLSEKSSEFADIAAKAKHFLTTSLAATVGSHLAALLESGSLHLTDAVRIETVEKAVLPASLERRFRACQSILLDKRSPASLKWKFSRETSVDAICINGCSSVNEVGGVDHLCTSGTVFYADGSDVLDAILHDPQVSRGISHGSLAAAVSAVNLGHGGYPGVPSPFTPGVKLVGAEVLLGKIKTMDEEDVPLLSNFSTDKCFQSLQEDGYDSILAQRTVNPFAPDAFVTFHRDQAVAKYIVTFSFSSRLNLPASLRQQRRAVDAQSTAPAMGNISAMADDVSAGYLNPPSISHRSSMCPEHPMKELEFWCAEEKKLLCSHCMFYQGYNKRNCSLLEDAASAESKVIDRWVTNADAFVKEMGSVIVAFDKAMEGIDTSRVEQISALKAFVNDVKHSLDALVVKAEASFLQTAESRTNELQNSLAAVVGVVHDVETVLISVKEAMRRRKSGAVSPFQSSLEMLAAVQQIHQPWKAVEIPPYMMPTLRIHREAILNAVEQATEFSDIPGPISLPEAIDANCLLR